MKYLILILVLVVLLALLFPRHVPRLFRRTGRTVGQFGRLGQELATGEEIRDSPLARYEVRAGEVVALRILADKPLSRDTALQEAVAAVGEKLARHARRREIPYRFAVVESTEPNAFAVPGGQVYITRGLLDLCEGGDDLLAGVLAHEMIHVDRWHAIRALAARTAVWTGIRVVSLGRAAVLSRIAGGMEDILMQGYRQDQEMEADAFGVRVAALAGFDPQGLPRLLERLERKSPDGQGVLAEVVSYFRSHPPVSVRLANIRKELSARKGT